MNNKMKKLKTKLLTIFLAGATVFPMTSFAETIDNNKMRYSTHEFASPSSYNILGYPLGSTLYKTTYGNGNVGGGYQTYLNTGSGGNKALDSFPTNGGAKIIDGLQITQTLSFISGGNYVKVEYKVKNTNSTSKTFSLGSCADIQIGSNDSAPIAKLSGDRGFTMKDGNAQFVFLGKGAYGVTDVDTFWFGRYSDRVTNLFNNTSTSSISSIDSGMAYSWKNRTISSGETQIYSVAFGIGQLNDPPTIEINTSLASQYYAGETVTISGKVNDVNSGDVVTVKYAIDNGTEYSVPGTYTPNGVAKPFSNINFEIPKTLSEGKHELKIWAVDNNGNMSNPKTVTFNVVRDSIAPTIAEIIKNKNIISLKPSTDDLSGVLMQMYSLNGEEWKMWTKDINTNDLEDGYYIMKSISIDNAGNISAEDSISFVTAFNAEVSVEIASKTFGKEDIDNAYEKVNKLPESIEKEELMNEISVLKEERYVFDRLIDIQVKLQDVNLIQEEYEVIIEELGELGDKINQLPNSSDNKYLLKSKYEGINKANQEEQERVNSNNTRIEYIVRLAQGHLREPYISQAKQLVNDLEVGELKKEMLKEITKLDLLLKTDSDQVIKNIERLIGLAEKYKREPYFTNAKQEINKLKDEDNKTKYFDKLLAIK